MAGLPPRARGGAAAKSYGVQAGGATREQVREALGDALREAEAAGLYYRAGASEDGSLAIAPEIPGKTSPVPTIACSATPQGQFIMAESMTLLGIEETADRVHDYLARGVLRYGPIGKNIDAIRLRHILSDAARTVWRIGGWYVVGATTERRVMLAPDSEAHGFVAPQSVYVGPLGVWTVSRLHPCRISNPDYTKFDIKPIRGLLLRHEMDAAAAGGPRPDEKSVVMASPALHGSIKLRTKWYGRLGASRRMRLLQLENAIEDAAMLGADGGGGGAMAVSLDGTGRVCASEREGGGVDDPAVSIEVDPEGLRVGGRNAEFAAAVRKEARAVHDRFLAGHGRLLGLRPKA